MTSARSLLKTAAFVLTRSERALSTFRSVRLRGKIVVLMYHEIADDDGGLDAWTVVRRGDFERQMDYLQENFVMLRLDEALERMSAGDVGDPACVVTFDDGYSGNRDVLLPIVTARRLPVSVFVATEAVAEQRLYWYDQLLAAWASSPPHVVDLRQEKLGRYAINSDVGARRWSEKERLLRDLKSLAPDARIEAVETILGREGPAPPCGKRPIEPLTIDTLRELAASPLVDIGAHSHSHDILTQLSPQNARRSVRQSKELLEAWTGKSVVHFSYPNGDHDDDVMRAVAELGFTCGLTTCTRPWSKDDSRFALPRIGIGRYDSFELFKARMSGLCRYA